MDLNTSLSSLFIGSFLAATLLPGGSEVMLVALLAYHPEATLSALLLATLGNTLGGLVSWGMGRLLPAGKPIKYLDQLHRHGSPILLLSWVPVLGDALCLGAGWLRLNFWYCALFILLGKAARYGVIVWLMP